MEIQLNGEPRHVGDGISIVQLLHDLDRDIVPRDDYASTRLEAGDVVEVVQFVGGG